MVSLLPENLKFLLNPKNLKPVDVMKHTNPKDFEEALIRDIYIRTTEDNLFFPKRSKRNYDHISDSELEDLPKAEQAIHDMRKDIIGKVGLKFMMEGNKENENQKLLIAALTEVLADQSHDFYKTRVKFIEEYKRKVKDKNSEEYKEYTNAAKNFEEADKIEKMKKTIKYAMHKAKLIWKKINEDFIKDKDFLKKKPEDRAKEYQNLYPEFFKPFPAVLNHMAYHLKFHPKAFFLYLKKVYVIKTSALPQKEMYKQMDQNNAFYVKMLFQLTNKHPPQNEVDRMYQDALKYYSDYTEKSLKAYENSKELIEKEDNQNIQSILKDLIAHAKNENNPMEERIKSRDAIKHYMDALKNQTTNFNPHKELDKIHEESKIQSIPEMEKLGQSLFSKKYVSFPYGYNPGKLVNFTYEIKKSDYTSTFHENVYKTNTPNHGLVIHKTLDELLQYLDLQGNNQ